MEWRNIHEALLDFNRVIYLMMDPGETAVAHWSREFEWLAITYNRDALDYYRRSDHYRARR